MNEETPVCIAAHYIPKISSFTCSTFRPFFSEKNNQIHGLHRTRDSMVITINFHCLIIIYITQKLYTHVIVDRGDTIATDEANPSTATHYLYKSHSFYVKVFYFCFLVLSFYSQNE